ncbi:RNA polymerase sigma-70 factor, ECF subfamily [Micrococcales bacterium KH10]|nr:RNA polymerase sigma-70 factor, ECF subfamily [Micrococcales bacterium KH10]
MARWEQLLEAVVADHSSALLTYGRMLTGNPADSEDLLHDALIKSFAKPSHMFRLASDQDEATGTVKAVAYVRRTMATIHIDQHRRRTRWFERAPLLAVAESAPDSTGPINDRHDVYAALQSLSPTQRTCVLLRYYDDLTVPQIADVINASQGTIKRHLHDGLERLRSAPALLDHLPQEQRP